jgi:choice-of-anchor B domain-containing protein
MTPSRIGLLLASALAAAPVGAAPAACTAGSAAGHACHRIDLEARLDTATLGYGNLNDIWGWTDPVTGREYALVGAVGGTVFVDVTDAANPRVVGRLPAHEDIVIASAKGGAAKPMCKAGEGAGVIGDAATHDGAHDACGEGGSTWRSIKAYRDHAYIGSEAAGHGIQVFDLTQLRAFPPGSAVQRFGETARYAGVGSSHTVYIDEQSGFLYAVGSGTYSGGLHIVDLAVPDAPVAAGGYAGDGYTHEALCTVYAGPDARYTGRQVCLASNEDTLTILDVTDKSNIVQVSRTGYAGAAYTHQGWLSADQRYIFVNDELDEVRQDIRTRTLVFDLLDLTAPVLVDQLHQPRFVIDHNNFVRDGFVYQSNYTAGLVILDGRDSRRAFEVAYFDTFPADDVRKFDGTWSNYPFFGSGLTVVSDISRGLYVLRPRLGGAASDARVTLSAGGGSFPEMPGGTVTPGVGGGTFTVSVGPNTRIGTTVAIDSAGVAPTCVFSDSNRVMRCRLVDATPFQYAVSVQSEVAGFAASTDVVAMVAGGGDETAPTDNRATLAYAAPAPIGDGGGSGGGGGALDLMLLFGLAGAAMRRPMRRLQR